MEADDETLALFDFNWFRRFILNRSPPPEDKFPVIFSVSLSSEPPQTIPSGKVTIKDPKPIEQPCEIRERTMRRDRYRRGSKRIKNWGSKSLSDLEFEELKGFMDLGFTFSDAEASDPWLISIVPGLQRLRPVSGSESPLADSSMASETTDEIVVARPYLSEAWEVEEEVEEKRLRVLRSWKTPANGEGVDLKDQLRFWAQAVASAVI